MTTKQVRGKYTLEFKLETVRPVEGGPSATVTAKVLGVPKANVSNWVGLRDAGQLTGAGDKPVTPEQIELARSRAELAWMTMERDIEKSRVVGRATTIGDFMHRWTASVRCHSSNAGDAAQREDA